MVEKKGMSHEEAEKIGAETAAKLGIEKYGKGERKVWEGYKEKAKPE